MIAWEGWGREGGQDGCHKGALGSFGGDRAETERGPRGSLSFLSLGLSPEALCLWLG